MTPKELNLMLISKFPELEGKYRENPNWQGGDETSPSIGYDELFRREIISLLNTERYAQVKRYLDFLEELIVENDYDVDVATITLLKDIFYCIIDEDKIIPLLGPKTLKAWNELKQLEALASKKLNLRLIAAFPELEREYREETEWQDGDETGSHVVYGDVLMPRIYFLLENKKYAEAKKYLDFTEELIAENEEYGVNVAVVTIVEGIFYSYADKNEIPPLLGPETLKVWNEFAEEDIQARL